MLKICGLFIVIYLALLGNTAIAGMNKATMDSLNYYGLQLTNADNDSDRVLANTQFYNLLSRTLNAQKQLNNPIKDSVKILSQLLSTDGKLCVYTWALPATDETYKYFGFVHLVEKKKLSLHKLIDKSDEITSLENALLNNTRWWGCVYYKMVEKQSKGVTYYTLLGWDGNDATSNKKVIELLSVGSNGLLKMGASLFYYPKEKITKRRVVFEYNDQAVMTLRYEALRDEIVFDGLSPSEERFKGNYAFYGPDMSFDSFQFKNGKWQYTPQIDILKDDRFYNPDNNKPLPKNK
jgi:hypothetical protein